MLATELQKEAKTIDEKVHNLQNQVVGPAPVQLLVIPFWKRMILFIGANIFSIFFFETFAYLLASYFAGGLWLKYICQWFVTSVLIFVIWGFAESLERKLILKINDD